MGLAIFVQIQLVSHVLTKIVDAPLLNSSLEKRQIPGIIQLEIEKHTYDLGIEINSMASVCLMKHHETSLFMDVHGTFPDFSQQKCQVFWMSHQNHQNLPQRIGFIPPPIAGDTRDVIHPSGRTATFGELLAPKIFPILGGSSHLVSRLSP